MQRLYYIYLIILYVATLLSLSQQKSGSNSNGKEKSVQNHDNLGRGNPPPEYTYIQGIGYYKLEMQPKNFLNAQRYCENDGAHLAILNSQAEAEALANLFRPYFESGKEWPAIGFGDFFGRGQFQTIFGNPITCTGYMNWNTGEPRNTYERNCGWMNLEGRMGTQCCDCNKWFICEFGSSSEITKTLIPDGNENG